MTDANLMVPVVHLNGTNGIDLFRQFYDAKQSAEATRKLMAEGFPHGRDYYPKGDAAYRAARDLREEQLRQLTAMIQSLEHIALEVYGQLSQADQRKAMG